MPSGGTVRIETTERHVAGAARGRHLRPGHYVVLAVSDTGAALDPETLSQVFEPDPAVPAAPRPGLGLSIVYGIVKQSGGYISVSSEVGRGATFWIFLPLAAVSEPSPVAV
jgi:signal transduction histidine kinase